MVRSQYPLLTRSELPAVRHYLLCRGVPNVWYRNRMVSVRTNKQEDKQEIQSGM